MSFPLFARFLEGQRSVLDLASGSGRHIDQFLDWCNREGVECRTDFQLSDIHPSDAHAEKAVKHGERNLEYLAYSVDATSIPRQHRGGVRSMFQAFHHLRPHQARQCLADAVEYSDGVFIFEPQLRTTAALLSNILGIPFGILAGFFGRPFPLLRLFFSTLVPIIPVLFVFDGVMSVLRSYSANEVSGLIESLPDNDFEWQIDIVRGPSPFISGLTGLVVVGKRRQNRT